MYGILGTSVDDENVLRESFEPVILTVFMTKISYIVIVTLTHDSVPMACMVLVYSGCESIVCMQVSSRTTRRCT